MFLLVAATEEEMRPVRGLRAVYPDVDLLVSGVGPLETTLSLCRYLSQNRTPVSGVISFGVAGGYPAKGVGLLNLCLARKEVVGDLGVWTGSEIIDFAWLDSRALKEFELDSEFLRRGLDILIKQGMSPVVGTFVSVSCVSGTALRGNWLRDRYDAICENMEGAAIARVCKSFALPCLELRAISNMVEDRDLGKWQLSGAITQCAQAVEILLTGLAGESLE
ncbi:MAG: futalosine hydrolase [Deltaproteobacteria bacterium RIFOXYD12_FULL_50_9]|nr:MAG: futalosine hydrolase [Deltaproteobacteria bacterium RIFOXYD12_FULL_50_9]